MTARHTHGTMGRLRWYYCYYYTLLFVLSFSNGFLFVQVPQRRHSQQRQPRAVWHHHLNEMSAVTPASSSPSSATNFQQDEQQDKISATLSSATITTQLQDWLTLTPPQAELRLDVIEFAQFGSNNNSCRHLRGLKWKEEQPLPTAPVVVARIPLPKVISTTRSNGKDRTSHWDADLACKLWKELKQGKSSPYWAYLQLLTNHANANDNDNDKLDDCNNWCPDSVAPNSLRQWSSAQKDRLNESQAGTKLLQLEQQQERAWREKYRTSSCLKDENGNLLLSWEQFRWAMEVVHSRAFQGAANTDKSIVDSLASELSLAAPFVAAAMGATYALSTPETQQSNGVLAGFAVMATLPLVWKIVFPDDNNNNSNKNIDNNDNTVALLPFIDSANHLQEADDSSIDYNPMNQCFELTVGPRCIDATTRQVYVRYGNKSNAELLLNYGFLPHVDEKESDEDNDTNDRLRAALAQEYCRGNNIDVRLLNIPGEEF